MKYKVMWLPVDKPLEDGCRVIKSNGDTFEYSLYEHEHMAGFLKRAEIFIVSIEYNTMLVMGKPSRNALKWLKEGMEVKMLDCEKALYDDTTFEYNIMKNLPDVRNADNVVIRIKCPVCHQLH